MGGSLADFSTVTRPVPIRSLIHKETLERLGKTSQKPPKIQPQEEPGGELSARANCQPSLSGTNQPLPK